MVSDGNRGNWKNWYEYLFSCIGCLVGLGNIWRFPYICFKNGGGAFLIPYFLCIIVTAMPLMFIEIVYSQYSNLGPGRVWICCPLFQGIGIGMVVLTGIVSIYYTVILAWTLYYFVNSFFPVIPWSNCDNDWNTPKCYQRGLSLNETRNGSSLPFSNDSKTSTEEFWERHVLEITDSISDAGAVRWQLLLCLMVAWTIVFLCLLKGIKTSGKVVYIAATVPYLFLIVLFVRGITLPGSFEGLKFFVIPRWADLTKISVWGDAAVQTFYSAGLGWGGIATLASYNHFNNNCYRDALLLPVLDAVTSFFSGCVIFATLGYMAYQANVDIHKVVAEGPGIAFKVYPEALSMLPLPQLWSILFFAMLFTVGLDSQMVHVQTLSGALLDRFPKLLRNKNTLVTAVICILGLILGIPCVTQGGIYVLTLIDWYCASVSVMLLALLEVTVLAWIYGADRLYDDLAMMIGYRPHVIWGFLWKIISPLCIVFVWLFSVIQMTPVEYAGKQYPRWSVGLGWLIAVISLIPIPVFIVKELLQAEGNLISRIKKTTQPAPAWKPAIIEIQKQELADLTLLSEEEKRVFNPEV